MDSATGSRLGTHSVRGRPRLLMWWETAGRAEPGTKAQVCSAASGGARSAFPKSDSCCRSRNSVAAVFPARCSTAALLTLVSNAGPIPRIWRRHLALKPSSRRLWAAFKQHAASPYISFDKTSVSKIRIFLFEPRMDLDQTLLRLLNSFLAMPILAFSSRSTQPSALNIVPR